jgi:outer membrane protein TolC
MSWQVTRGLFDTVGSLSRGSGTTPVLAALVLSAILAGCAVGPDFKRPATPDVSDYIASPLPAQTASAHTAFGESQRFGQGGMVEAEWWQTFGSAKLDALIKAGLEASPTLASARATLMQAQEIYSVQSASTFYPQVDVTAGAQRQRMNPGALGQAGDAREFNLHDAGIGVRYQLDLAGGNRRALEALAARAEYRRYELEGARLTLAGSIVRSAVTQAMLAGQMEATQAILLSWEEQLRITQERVRLGHAQPNDALALQAEVEQTRAELTRLRKQLQQSEHQLAVRALRRPTSRFSSRV